MSNVVKYTLRLNWKKEDERKIISFLNNLYKDIYPTKASYIKDAIKYHINHIMEEEILDAKHLKEKGDESLLCETYLRGLTTDLCDGAKSGTRIKSLLIKSQAENEEL